MAVFTPFFREDEAETNGKKKHRVMFVNQIEDHMQKFI